MLALKPIWNYINNKYKLKISSQVWIWEEILLSMLSIHLLIQFDKQFSDIQTGKQPYDEFFICLIRQSIWTMQKFRFRILHDCNEKSMLLSSFSTLPYTLCHWANKKCLLHIFVLFSLAFVNHSISPFINSKSMLQTPLQNPYWFNYQTFIYKHFWYGNFNYHII